MRKTKIICTLGPASSDEATLREMMKAGMDVARLNFSHGTYEEHRKKANMIKKLRQELNLHTALLLDTKGPEIRLGTFEGGCVALRAGQHFSLYMQEHRGDENGVSVSFSDLYRDVTPGGTILIDDGLIELRVAATKPEQIDCTVVNGGTISDRKGVNVPGAHLSIPFLSEKDRADIAFGVEEDFDFIAASFTQSAADIVAIRDELERLGNPNIRIIAKIENSAGVANANEILEVSDGIMVARGDMGVEIPMEEIPIVQKRLISRCFTEGKQVITATQMLESMTRQPRPTRAEITDVANAIYDGTSAIMLSGETAAGQYPVEAVRTMARIAERTESDIDYRARFADRRQASFSSVSNAISHATCTTAQDLRASAIITVTTTGTTARQISRFRPETPIIGCSPDLRTCRQMNMSWGVTPLYMEEKQNTDELFSAALEVTKEHGLVENGNVVVITAGLPLGVPGTTNMLKVQLVGNVLVTGKGIGDQSVCGNLCVCADEDEALHRFRPGEILVVPTVSPKSLDILRHAKGVICEHGGKNSYASMACEILNIPGICEAVGATRILVNGTAVALDARRGLVFTGQVN